ncbi:hypothetical protein ACFX14_002555 [Malus domestica]
MRKCSPSLNRTMNKQIRFTLLNMHGTSKGLRYQDIALNVDSLNLIHVGITLFDDRGNVGGTWEFNFRGFDEETDPHVPESDEETDPHVPESIALLKANGLDLEKFGKFGIDSDIFVEGFVEILRVHRGQLVWVSFHGLYDSAYVMKLVTRKTILSSPTEFAKMAGRLFERVYDLKFMAKYCPGLFGGEIGLERMATILGVQRWVESKREGEAWVQRREGGGGQKG